MPQGNTTGIDTHYREVLSHLFGRMGAEDLSEILGTGTIIQLKAGEYLFRQGDQKNSLYLVLSGRLRALANGSDGYFILGDITEGEPVGEFAMFTNEPRMASVLAIRKSTVLEIDRDDYYKLIAKTPKFAGVLTQFIINRFRQNALQRSVGAAPKNIAIINLEATKDLTPWTIDIQARFSELNIPLQVVIYEAHQDDNFEQVFDNLDVTEGINILVCNETQPSWSRHCLIYADLVIIASDFNADSALYPIENELDLYRENILNKKIYLLLLHDENAPAPKNTQRWFQNRSINLHIHLRKHNARDTRRFCRILTHQAVGLVLSGGGTKGYAHVGAVKALMEEGIEIDFLGGTSAGALYGLGMSQCDFNFDEIDRLCLDSASRKLTSNDYSIPFHSILSGRKVKKFIRDVFSESHLEDIWVNSYCVSANFSTAAIKVHDRGLTWKRIQASIAIPGVFPPVVIDKELHVDGCVVDNLPIEPMYRYPVGRIIAIALSALETITVNVKDMPSSSAVLWDKVTGKNRIELPSLTTLLIDSLTLNSRQKQENAKSRVSLYFEMDLKGVGQLDEGKWREVLRMGHDQTKAFLEQLPREKKFWLHAQLPVEAMDMQGEAKADPS